MTKEQKKSADQLSGALQEVQAAKDEEEAKGFHGVEVDQTPNENYTVAGVLAGKPTPETDPDLHAEAHKAAGLSKFPQKGGK